MYFCLNCKKQFFDQETRLGECPYCGQINQMALNRCRLERFTLKKNYDRIKKIKKYIKNFKA